MGSVQSQRLKQSVCRWCYPNWSLDELASVAEKLGLAGIDLLDPEDFEALQPFGLACTMTNSHPIEQGLAHPQHHAMCLASLEKAIEATAAAGWRNVICFSGNRDGLDDETAWNHCATALGEILPLAKDRGVVLHMELLNSRVDHPDYLCDRSAWGCELVRRIGSDHFRLLFDIYHMQIMEGDLIRTIRNNGAFFGHYHTAGNPGRKDLDGDQELNYRAIAAEIARSGFQGFLAHEFTPKGCPEASLQAAVELCRI